VTLQNKNQKGKGDVFKSDGGAWIFRTTLGEILLDGGAVWKSDYVKPMRLSDENVGEVGVK
jgi:hypothetical protein